MRWGTSPLMKTLKVLALVAMILGVTIAITTVAVESTYAGKAKLVQRVRKDAGSDLFGDSGTPVGSPQLLIIDDRRAFTGDKTPTGAEIVDESYLEKSKTYPLQLKTVMYVSGLVRLASLLAAGVGLLVYVLVRRRNGVQLKASTIGPS